MHYTEKKKPQSQPTSRRVRKRPWKRAEGKQHSEEGSQGGREGFIPQGHGLEESFKEELALTCKGQAGS